MSIKLGIAEAMETIVPRIERDLIFRAVAMKPIKSDITITTARSARLRKM
jgi:hypothetical protein